MSSTRPDVGPKVLAVADTDSYLKWTAATLAALPPGWDHELVLITNPVAPSAEQARAATGADSDLPRLSRARFGRLVAESEPDVVLLGCTGPVVRDLIVLPELSRPGRPVLVTGLPGISVPATDRALQFRAGCDLFVLHSRRERAEFAAVAAELGLAHRFALARLPFLVTTPQPIDPGARDIVFAAQAKVPRRRIDREALLGALVEVPAPYRPVVKLRGRPGEEQTHREQWAYPDLAAERGIEHRLTWSTESMAAALGSAAALVTVSSTAALEAVAMDLPSLVIDEFGVSADLINVVFEGSGLLGGLAALRAGDFRHVNPVWKQDNYFHDAAENTLVDDLEELIGVRDSLPRPRPVAIGGAGSRLRRFLRLRLPTPVWASLSAARRTLRPR